MQQFCVIKFTLMHTFKIVPLSKEYARKVRETGFDEFGHPVVEEVMTGTGPCRVSLRQLRPGIDKRLVVNHTPFEKDNAPGFWSNDGRPAKKRDK